MKTAIVALTLAGGDTELVAAVPNKRIVVNGCVVTFAATGTLVFEDGAGGGSLAGTILFAGAADPVLLPPNPAGYFSTSPGVALNAVLTGAGTTAGGVLNYSVV